MHQSEPAVRTRRDLPPFLRHLATLLTCGGDKACMAAQVVAITGIVEERGVKALVVTQNAAATQSTPFFLKGHKVAKSNETFDAIISGDANVPLNQHIVDLLGLFSSCDRTDASQIMSVATFVTMRSMYKLFARLTSDKQTWKIRVAEILKDWKPTESDESFEPFWVKKPKWAIDMGMEEAMMEKRGEGDSEEWLFSTKSIGVWANTLGTLLSLLESHIKEYKGFPQDLREQPMKPSTKQLKKDVQETLYLINSNAVSLHRFLTTHVQVVKKILAQKSIEHTFMSQTTMEFERIHVIEDLKNKWEEELDNPTGKLDMGDEMDDEHVELQPEDKETEGQRIYRYLQTIAAWHAGIATLLLPKYESILAGVSVGLVEVAGRKTDLMNRDEFATEYLARTTTATSDDEVEIRKIFASLTPTWFTGTIHAEATLMGLLTYFSHPETTSNYIGDMDADMLRTLFEPVLSMTTTPTIGVGKKCCWCCYKLAQLLKARKQEILLPGTHGVFYAWSPPRVGVDIQVLKMMERELWEKLEKAVTDRLAQIPMVKAHSRQSSGSSTDVEFKWPVHKIQNVRK
ncbi:hypothetical protein NLJ89_g7524 [Agrocybe chaxingu]|uniref:Uncharacterized protein n=1 Tax=Agrocybe chaxingu TaxID=84603 RepID=A0A9W8K3G1_9AGAR|nr:hypothetical protein NLJ89_g7524 [Agrocybe chaxingu]